MNPGTNEIEINSVSEIQNVNTKNFQVYVGQRIFLEECRYRDFAGTFSPKVVYSRSTSNCYVSGVSPGTTEILLQAKAGYTQTASLLQIEVLPLPTPEVYSYKIEGANTNLSVLFPSSTAGYTMSYEGENLYTRVLRYDTSISLEVSRLGKSKISFKDSQGFVRYIIEIESVPEIIEKTLFQTETQKLWFGNMYNTQSKDTTIAQYSGESVTAKKVGKTQLEVRHSYGLAKIVNITVLPVPEPIRISCDIMV